jgi:acyl-CoA dehydrogenase
LDPKAGGGWPSAAWTALDSAGLTSVGYDEMRGGSGGSLFDIATLVFEVGRDHSNVPLAETVMLSSWLGALANWQWSGGAETVGIAHDVHLETRRIGESLFLSGSVADVPWARFAKRVTLVANVEGKSVLIALNPAEALIEPGENLAGEPRDTLIIESLILGPERFYQTSVTTEMVELRGAFTRAVASVGALCAMYELTLNFVQQREQFGRRIETFQAVQHLLARLGEEVYAAMASVSATVVALELGDGLFEAMCAVVRVIQAATYSARVAHQLHGAIGTTVEYPLHQYTQRLWCWKSEYGSEAKWSRAIATYARDRGDEASLWSVVTVCE